MRRTFLYELVNEKPEPGLAAQEQHSGARSLHPQLAGDLVLVSFR